MAYKNSDKSLTSGTGMCSYKKNPMAQPRMVSSQAGPGYNPDQQKANKLLQKAYKQWDSNRGKGVI